VAIDANSVILFKHDQRAATGDDAAIETRGVILRDAGAGGDLGLKSRTLRFAECVRGLN
jgi:hypothetical protein